MVGIGNALVDVLAAADDQVLERLDLTKGAMQLVDEARMAEVYEAMGPGTEISGGSAANTMVGVAALGGSAHYIGRVRDDQLGRVFGHDLRAAGVGYSTTPAPDGPATGCCLILVTPDAQRTMNTFLGASSLLDPDDVDPTLLARARVLYMEGYLFDRPEAQRAFERAAEIAHGHGAEVSLTLSDVFCVERHRAAFRNLVAGHVDLLFANEAEVLSLYETDDLDRACGLLAEDCPLGVVTRSEHGAVLVEGGRRVAVPAEPVEQLVDTTGAGDLFAAGFLRGHTLGLDRERCLRLGAVAAAEVISHLGPRPQDDLVALAGDLLSS